MVGAIGARTGSIVGQILRRVGLGQTRLRQPDETASRICADEPRIFRGADYSLSAAMAPDLATSTSARAPRHLELPNPLEWHGRRAWVRPGAVGRFHGCRRQPEVP